MKRVAYKLLHLICPQGNVRGDMSRGECHTPLQATAQTTKGKLRGLWGVELKGRRTHARVANKILSAGVTTSVSGWVKLKVNTKRKFILGLSCSACAVFVFRLQTGSSQLQWNHTKPRVGKYTYTAYICEARVSSAACVSFHYICYSVAFLFVFFVCYVWRPVQINKMTSFSFIYHLSCQSTSLLHPGYMSTWLYERLQADAEYEVARQ